MNDRDHAAEPSSRTSRQFSLRELFKLTLVVSLILTIGVLSRGSRYFDALSSPWAVAALAPTVLLLVLHRLGLASARALVVASVAFYAISMCVPAMSLQILRSPEMFWGWQMFYLCVMGFVSAVPEFLVNVFSTDQRFSERDLYWLLAIVMGSIANVAYVLAIIGYLLRTKLRRAATLARRASHLAAALAILLIVPVAVTMEIVALYPGYGLWVASMIAVIVATRRAQRGLERPSL